MSITALLIWFACHFLGDFPLQGDYLSNMKGKSWEHLIYHCATYTGVFVLFAHASPVQALALFAPHVMIDAIKSRYHKIPYLWLDQALHLLTIVLILLFVRG